MSIFERVQGIFRREPGDKKDKSPPSERGWTDREITKIEDDRFDFRDYAEVLADPVCNAEPPLTIGIYGSWGSGKSSLMNLIRGELREIETIQINVWQLSNQEEVWQAFLQALFNRVNSKLRWWQRVQWRKLGRELVVNSYRIVVVIIPIILGGLIGKPDASWLDVINTITNPFSSTPVGSLTSLGLFLWLLVKPAIEASRQVVNIDLKSIMKHGSYEEQITELMKLQNRFAGMVEDLVGKDGRLVVFIDDLDRCTPDKIPDLLEAIKLFTTTPKCVYVLGLDHDIVRQGIYKKYTFEDKREAEEYLEKIVQVPFHLPPLDEGKIEDFVRRDYPHIIKECPSAAEVFSKGLEPNPRKVKRALNIYRTLLDLAEKRVSVWEMDPIDDELTAKIVVIQSRYRKLHEYLTIHPEFLIDIESQVLDGKEDSDVKIHEIKAKIREDKTGEILLGDDKEPGLIDTADFHGLVAMLLTGVRHFTDEDQKDQINSYIYLIATAEGGATGVRPSRREREALLGGDYATIEAQVDKIKQQGVEETYSTRLMGVLGDLSRYTPAEVASANLALDLLEDREREEFEPQTVRVPAGSFLMGSSDNDELAFENEKPQHTVELSGYLIGKYPVTNREYQNFVSDEGYKPPKDWSGEQYPSEKGDHPVVKVSWEEAQAYCQWLSEKTGRDYRLPTEAEWEKAARGQEGRLYPWGDEWVWSRCNSASEIGDTTPVGQFSPQGDSPYGVADTSGNVWEWCADLFDGEAYKRRAGSQVVDPEGPKRGTSRVLRGGAFQDVPRHVRCAGRLRLDPVDWDFFIGFRVIVSPSGSGL